MENKEWGGLPLESFSNTIQKVERVIDRTIEKKCSNCFSILPLTSFYKNKRWGYQSRCKECNPKVWSEYKERTKNKPKRQYKKD